MVVSMERWQGKVAIVTGASAGIGAGIAEALVKAGLKVVGLARRVDRIETLAQKLSGQSGKLYAVKADMTKESDILAAFKWTSDNVGPVSVLINNAGLTMDTDLINGDTAKWRTVFDTNVLGLSIATREAVKIMRANRIDGHIVHINSVTGHKVVNFPNLNVYPASKYAVTALTETLRQELNRNGLRIKVTSLSPGAVKTEMSSVFDNNPNVSKDMIELIKKMEMLKVEDIADSVLYVLSTPPHVQIHELTIAAYTDP